MTPPSIGDISPTRKRQIAYPLAENGASHKQQKSGGVMLHAGAKLMDAVHILAANLNRLIEWNKERKTGLSSNQAIARKAGMSSNTVGRMRRADGSVGIGNLSKVAKAFGLQAMQLLSPGLNPANPPEVVSDDAEKTLLTAFRDRRKPEPTVRH